VSEQILSPTLLDLARELRKRGRGEEADYWVTTIPLLLHSKAKVNLEDAYTMTIDDIEFELSKPQAPEGWDNTVWGKAIICPR
jgi:hypothetical protein